MRRKRRQRIKEETMKTRNTTGSNDNGRLKDELDSFCSLPLIYFWFCRFRRENSEAIGEAEVKFELQESWSDLQMH
jgi:hypothetical protein